MDLTKGKRFKYFKVTWLILILGTVCDLTLSGKVNLGFFNINIQLSSIAVIIYIISFFIVYPLKEFPAVFKNKLYRNNIIVFTLLLIIAYVSSYFSLFQKYALVTTTSRYTLYLMALVISLSYVKYFEKAGEFILKSFIYTNFLIILSCLADYYIPDFYQFLVDHFGHMESKHSVMRIDGVVYKRPSGFITDTNLTAFSLGFSSFILLINRNKFNKYFEYAFYIFAGYCFGMASSRSALILVIFLLVFALIMKKVNWRNGVVYFLLFIAVQFITPQTQARFFDISNKEKKIEEMELGRPLIWKADYLAMRIKPVIGIGSGVFFKLSDTLIARVKNEITDEQLNTAISDTRIDPVKGINPHNIFFTMQIEYGIAGTVLFVIIVLYNIINFLKTKNYLTLAAALGILFVSSLSNYAPYYKYYLLMFIIFYVLADYKLRPGNEVPKG